MATAEPAEEKNLQITRVEGGNLRIDHGALRKIFNRPELKGKKFAIISITGKMRTGKSFLMNFVLRYLRRRGWDNKEWMGNGAYAIGVDGLPFAGGVERCTTGIRIFDEIFEVPIAENETMMVMLMDTQGLFDNKTPEVVNKSLLTLTTLMSSVQIFNSKENIDSQTMEYLKTCVDFALKTAKAAPNQGVKCEGYMKLQNLMFLVRDFPEDDDGSFGLESGNKYLHDILSSNEGGHELVRIRTRIRESFDSVEGFAMPHPGLEATKKKFQARNKDIKDYFRVYVQQLVEHIMNPRNLVPKRSSTKTITPREMLNMIAACDNVFAERMIDAQSMMTMNEKTHYSSKCQESIMAYDNLMKDINYKDIDVDGLQNKHNESKENAIQELKKAEFIGDDDRYGWKDHYLKHFSTQCENHFANTMREYNIQKQNRELKTTGILLKYESDMKSGISEPLSDDEFEALHERNKQAVRDSCDDSDVLNTVFDRMIEVCERLKEENKLNRENAKKEEINRQRMEDYEKREKKTKLINRLSLKSKKKWDEFVKTLPDDSAMQKKKREIFSISSSEYVAAAGQMSEAGKKELTEELDRRYKDAKQISEQNWKLAKQRMDNAAEAMVLKVRKNLSETMVDCYIEEDKIRKCFSQLMEKEVQDALDAKFRSERAKQYFKKTLKKKCDDATEDVLGQNRMNKKSNDISLGETVGIVIIVVAAVAVAGLLVSAAVLNLPVSTEIVIMLGEVAEYSGFLI